MKLLIITQKVDMHDPILGFFHNWLLKLSEKYERLTVICLERGEYNLPQNIKVLSLGKENKGEKKRGKVSKMGYIFNFYRYIWRERENYDAVFVHMNQEYVLLGWKLWKLLGKKIYLWRNHKQGNLLTRFAVLVSHKVFCTSKDSFTARFKKTVLMPVGIDTEIFKNFGHKRDPYSILFLGRIAPVKKVDLFLEVLKLLKEKNIACEADVYGDALPKDQEYFDNLLYKNMARFHAAVSNSETPRIYNAHRLYVNLTPSGSFDKTILEAAACGCIPVITNVSLKSVSEFSYCIADQTVEDIADTIALWLKADSDILTQKSALLRVYVEREHSLRLLVEKLKQEIV